VRTQVAAVIGLVLLGSVSLARGQQFDAWLSVQFKHGYNRIWAAASPLDGQPGAVIASPSRKAPDYYCHWVRDGALTMRLVEATWEAGGTVEDELLQSYAAFARMTQTACPTPNSPATCGVGEPKFYVSGAVFGDPWGRPQNDGPALRARLLVRYANGLRAQNRPIPPLLYEAKMPPQSVIKADLEHVAHHWRDKDVDLWEESRGYHFFTRMAQHRALREGAQLADALHDPGAASAYRTEADALKQEIEKHWNPGRGYIEATREPDDGNFKPSQLDCAVILGAIQQASQTDPLFSPSDDRVLATALRLIKTFRELYPINAVRVDRDNSALQPGIGRYPEDRYDGYCIQTDAKGNPWFLCTAAMAELCYRATADWREADIIRVTPLNVEFLREAIKAGGMAVPVAPDQVIPATDERFAKILQSCIEYGDGFLRRIRHHGRPDSKGNCDLSEQFNRDHGLMQGAPRLTWSYAAFCTASVARGAAQAAIGRPARPVLQPVAPR
jgi:glucoamylase